MQSFTNRLRELARLLGRGILWAYVFAVLPSVLLSIDMLRTISKGQNIALHLFLLTLFAPVAVVTLYVTWYKIRHRKGN